MFSLSTISPYRRYLTGLTVIGLILGALIFKHLSRPCADGTPSDMNPLHSDFLNYWAAPQIAAQHLPTLFDLRGYLDAVVALCQCGDPGSHNWSYMPHTLFFLMPFGQMPLFMSFMVWVALGLACFLWCARLCLPATKDRTFTLGMLALSPAALLGYNTGQNSFFIAAAALGVSFEWPDQYKRGAVGPFGK